MFCSACGTKNDPVGPTCVRCGARLPAVAPPGWAQPPPQDIGQSAGVRMLIPVGRSGWAIAAGYLGLFSFFCLAPGPFAILCGVMAIRNIKRDPKLHGLGRAWFGIVTGAITTIVLLIGLIVVIRGDLR